MSSIAASAPAARSVAVRRWIGAHRGALILAAVALVALLGFAALREVLAEVRLKDVRAALHAIPPGRIALAAAFTVLSYLALTLYDLLALKAIGRPLPWRTAALASFTSYTLSHNLGLSLLTGGSARYRIYSASGLDLGDVAKVSLIAGMTFWTGVCTIVAAALLAATHGLIIEGRVLAPGLQHVIAIALLALLGGAAIARASGLRRLRIAGFSLPLPSIGLMGAQVGVAALDLLLASAALFVLVPGFAAAHFPAFFLAYAVAIIVALVAHVPGGIGVFEAVVLALAPGDKGSVFAALLVYRCVYYLLPLGVAGLLLGAIEGHRLRAPIAAGIGLADKAARAMAPPLIALLVFVGGLVLLISGALPAVQGRMLALADILPMPFIEGSHFAASLVGTALLLIAPALNARLSSGFHAARALLLGGALFSLLKGFDYEEASVLLIVAGLLQYCRPAFYRNARIFPAPLDPAWLVAAAAAIGLSLWAGFFAYKHVAYSDDLWWQFALHGNAPRFLRASLGVVVLAGGAALYAILTRPLPPAARTVLPPEVADRALAQCERSDAMLAFTGDKSFLVSDAGDAFLMYAVRGRTWVMMGDPIGPRAEWDELIWALRTACDAAHGRLCFYQVSEEMLAPTVELGLQAMKYGEEAHVPLGAFTLDGPKARPLRHALRKAEAAGLSFEIAEAVRVPGLMPELRRVSEAWLRDKGGAEKRFSLGRFDPDYLARFDCALVRQGDRIIAFANIWPTAAKSELSVDLMRHLPEPPYGTMDFLFVRLMQWGQRAGYRSFNLGLAPLSGIRGGRLAPLWAKAANAVFSNGERLYGFLGLRAFKAKYAPEWTPRYIAVPHGLEGPRALIDLVAMVGV